MDNPILRQALVGFLLARALHALIHGKWRGMPLSASGRQAERTRPARRRAGTVDAALPPVRTERLLGLSIARLDPQRIIERLIAWSDRPPGRVVADVGLPFVHAARRDPLLRRALEEADLLTTQSRTFALLARHEDAALPAAIDPADLLDRLLAKAAVNGRSVFLFGGAFQSLHESARRLKARHPRLILAGAYAPPDGFERDPQINAQILTILRTVRPDFVLVLQNGPRALIWSAGMADSVRHGVFLSLGKDVLAPPRRAPGILRAVGLGGAWRSLVDALCSAWRGLGALFSMPRLYKMHRRDRIAHGARQRRRRLALESEARYRSARATTRRSERDRALLQTMQDDAAAR